MGISLRKLFLFLVIILLILIGMHFFSQSLPGTMGKRFSLTDESNIPTWYSAVLLFSVSLSSLLIYFFEIKTQGSDHPWHSFWLGFGCVYCFLSLDEVARIHEICDEMTVFKWIVYYAPLAGLYFGICTRYFLGIRKNDKSLRNLVLGGMIIYASGAMLMELISYLFHPLPPVLQQTEIVLEEGFEILGTIIVLMGCLQELQRLFLSAIARWESFTSSIHDS